MKRLAPALIALAFLTLPVLSRQARAADPLPVPPPGSFYLGVFPSGPTGEEDDVTLADLREFEQAAGKTARLVTFSQNWAWDKEFPAETCAWIREAGAVPLIHLLFWSGSDRKFKDDPPYSPQSIVNGEHDQDLMAWALAAKEYGGPLLLDYGVEVNGRWFPWSATFNGGDRQGGYGDPSYPDGAERFRDAFRHIVDLVRAQGADNVQFVFHVDYEDNPDRSWNRLELSYPGDGYVDWVGFSAYGAGSPEDDECNAFRSMADKVYPRLTALAPGKPVMVLEFGVAARNPRCGQAQWADKALLDLLGGRWPAIAGFTWWNEAWSVDDDPTHDTNMRVQDNPDLARVFQKHLANPVILGRE